MKVGASGAAVPDVVVTIKPLHSLVAGVMSGLKPPILLMEGEKSPHTQPLTPAEVRQLNEAQLIVWVGPSYEASLRQAIKAVKSSKQVITLIHQKGMRRYPIREGGLWGNHDGHSEPAGRFPHEAGHGHDASSIDGHLWLDPRNAKVIVKRVARKLSFLDSHHKAIYWENAQKLLKRLGDLEQELKQLVGPVKNRPYVVYHDGMQYFDRRFKTKGIGALTGGGHYGASAQHLLRIADYIRIHKIRCVFTEPQFPTDQIRSVIDKTGVRIETLDYLGLGLKADENAYFSMMRNLAHGLLKGLG